MYDYADRKEKSRPESQQLYNGDIQGDLMTIRKPTVDVLR
jgi:hypothetical protein